jgi:molybdate transport system substrate-binding protein
VNRLLHIAIALFLTMSFIGCGGYKQYGAEDHPDTVLRIFAAAGARLPTENVCKLYETVSRNRVVCNFASSGTLARQILSGAEADLIVSANRTWIEYLEAHGYISPGSIRLIAGNSLVVIAGADSDSPNLNFETTLPGSFKHTNFAMGDPAYVPVGRYTKMVLDSLGWYKGLKERAILAKDVSSVLHLVEMGACDWGVVYRSEAMQSENVRIIAEIPDSLHEPIHFYLASLRDHHEGTHALADLYAGSKGEAILLKYGFTGGKEEG